MTTRTDYLAYIQRAYEQDRGRLEDEIATWRRQFDPYNALFGYFPPGWPLALAAVAAFLYERTGDRALALSARDILLRYREWPALMPAEAVAARPEYANGVPPLEPVFQPMVFIPVYERLRHVLTPAEAQAMCDMVAHTFGLIRGFPEWGAHNRAMLRAGGLALAARAFPHHPEAGEWAEMADELAEESWGRWSIEDAMLYQPHWLRALFVYAEARGRADMADFIQPRLYLRSAVQMLTPLGTLPDFGDSRWMSSQWEWIACLEWGARTYRDPTMKWAASRLWQRQQVDGGVSVGAAAFVMLAWQWCDDSVPEQEPGAATDALDDLVMKKIVFRTGWDAKATYACVNYRDEGDYGLIARDYLRTTLAVSAEKMHHGHADEGSVALLLSGGSVLLHESGYRERLPDGIYRADIYHNRLAWRPALKPTAAGLLHALKDDGHYRPVRAERLYRTRLLDMEVSRTRVTDAARGIVWDRTIFYLVGANVFVFIDSVQALRSGPWTLSTLWWTTDILARGDRWCDTCISRIQGWQNPPDEALLLLFPQRDGGEIVVESERRCYQDEICVAHAWSGSLNAGQTVGLISVLWPHPRTDGVQPYVGAVEAVESVPAGRGSGVRLVWQETEYILATLHDLTVGWLQEDIRPRYVAERANTTYGPLQSDAAIVGAQRQRQQLWAGFVNGTTLSYAGQTLYAGQPFAMLQEDATARPGVPARFRWQGRTDLSGH